MRLALRILRVAGIVVGALIVCFVAFYLWASSGFDDTDPLRTAPERYGGDPSAAPPGARVSRLRVVSWNVAYARGRKDDAGDLRDEATIRRNLVAIAHVLRTLDADVVALQEVDFDSARTHGIDQVAWLAREAGYPWAARVETWRCRYVPYPYWPFSQHYGRMRSGQAVLSRFPITANIRHLLPQPEENAFWYNAFYLHRAVQHVEIAVGGNTTLDVLNVHLEAFRQGNRERHADILARHVRSLLDRPRVVLGDFNAIPPEAALRARFPDEPETDMTTDRTIATFRSLGFAEALPSGTPNADLHLPRRRLIVVDPSGSRRRAAAQEEVVREPAAVRYLPSWPNRISLTVATWAGSSPRFSGRLPASRFGRLGRTGNRPQETGDRRRSTILIIAGCRLPVAGCLLPLYGRSLAAARVPRDGADVCSRSHRMGATQRKPRCSSE